MTSDLSCHSRHPDSSQGATVVEEDCLILSNRQLNQDYWHLSVRASPALLSAQPGQFFHLRCTPTGLPPYFRRPMSFYRAVPTTSSLEFLYKVQGNGTSALAARRAGEALNVLGPLGQGFSHPAHIRHLLLLARGVGLATLLPLAESARNNNSQVTVVLSAKSPASLLPREVFAKQGIRQLINVTDQEGNSQPEHLWPRLQAWHAEQPFDFIATCGSNRLLKLAQQFATSQRIAGQVALEQHMACALGMCHACVKPMRMTTDNEQLTYKRVCYDGPVFDLQEVFTC